MKHKPSSAILGFDYILNLPSLGDDWVNVDKVIDRKTARKLLQLAAQTGASVVTVSKGPSRSSSQPTKQKRRLFRSRTDRMPGHELPRTAPTFCVSKSEMIAILGRTYIVWQV
jgi:hypothetical protein